MFTLFTPLVAVVASETEALVGCVPAAKRSKMDFIPFRSSALLDTLIACCALLRKGRRVFAEVKACILDHAGLPVPHAVKHVFSCLMSTPSSACVSSENKLLGFNG